MTKDTNKMQREVKAQRRAKRTADRAAQKARLVSEIAAEGRKHLRQLCQNAYNQTIALPKKSLKRLLSSRGKLPGMQAVHRAMEGFRDLLRVTHAGMFVYATLYSLEIVPCEVCAMDVPFYGGGVCGQPKDPWLPEYGIGNISGIVGLCGPTCAHAHDGMAALNGWRKVPFESKPGDLCAYAFLVDGMFRVIPQESRLAWDDENWRTAKSRMGQ